MEQPHTTPPLKAILTRGVAEVLPATDSLEKLMTERKIRVYLGIDPTGSLLTLGHSVVLRKLQQFAELGHEVILLIGSGTVRIGDPTGKDSTRPELTDEQIKENFKTWKEQASKVLDFSKIEIRYNGDWLDKLNYADMVKLMAKTTVQQLMERDMFQERLKAGKPIHGHEIIYPLLQGYDSVVMDVDLEIGGTDQTFNMLMGRTLQKQYNNKEKWVLSTPLINGTDGRKMSKSYGNFIALIDEPIDMYGKLMSVADEMIIEYFDVLTNLETSEISKMEEAIANGENPMTFKKKLAFTITEMYSSAEDAEIAAKHFEDTVQNKQIPEEIPEISLAESRTIFDAVKACLPEESNSQIRRLIEQGAVEFYYGDTSQLSTKPTDINETMQITNDSHDLTTIRIGKRKFFKVIL